MVTFFDFLTDFPVRLWFAIIKIGLEHPQQRGVYHRSSHGVPCDGDALSFEGVTQLGITQYVTLVPHAPKTVRIR
jgi:hypothetical protein